MSAPQDVFVHPQGICETDAVGPGSRIWAFAHVLPGVAIGRDVVNASLQAVINGAAQIRALRQSA